MQNVQQDLISGVLSEEELGTKLHVFLAQVRPSCTSLLTGCLALLPTSTYCF